MSATTSTLPLLQQVTAFEEACALLDSRGCDLWEGAAPLLLSYLARGNEHAAQVELRSAAHQLQEMLDSVVWLDSARQAQAQQALNALQEALAA